MQLTAHQPLARGVAAPARLGGARRQARHQPRRAAAGCRAALTVPEDAYLPVAKAHCFEKVNGKLVDRFVIEPVASAALEALNIGMQTSFVTVYGATISDVYACTTDKLPAAFQGVSFCNDWVERCEAAARTWQRHDAQQKLMGIVPPGTSRSDWNFSLEFKRVLNFENTVSDEDNVKQDMSIDVYGRQKEEGAKEKAKA